MEKSLETSKHALFYLNGIGRHFLSARISY